MSIEWNRKVAYSDDLRWKITWKATAMNLPYREISANLNVLLGIVSDGVQQQHRPNRSIQVAT